MSWAPSHAEAEGVIKFDLRMQDAPPPDARWLHELLAWRSLLFRLGLTGQNPGRYGGHAYGNMSRRLAGRSFIISGTQTGGKDLLSPEDFCVISEFDLSLNQVFAAGPVSPSSESLTHAAVYQANPGCKAVIHVHSPEIWSRFRRRQLPSTAEDIPYGTPAMACAVEELVQATPSGTIAMLGHEDGILGFGPSVEAVTLELLRHLAQSLHPYKTGQPPGSKYAEDP